MNASEGASTPAINLRLTCRLCLTVSDKLFQLFRADEVETSAIPLSMKVSLCTAIRISKHDVLPQKICENCMNYINEWYKFRIKCMGNDAYLKKHLTIREAEEREGKEQGKEQGNEEEERAPEQSGSGRQVTSPKEGEPGKPLMKAPATKLKCPLCPDSFYFARDLKLHKTIIHRAAKPEKAKVTSAAVDAKDEVKLDEVAQRSRYEMKCCEKVFFSKAKFRRHYNKKHPGEKPFMCETCGKKDFISEETLKRHKILHTGKYRCEICSKTFTCNAILIIHKRDKHENDKPFICDVCGKRFVTELLMNYHKRFHTGEKKYVCEECGLAVVTSSSLAKHKRIHSNVKPHVCQICGKGFIIKGRLVEHLRVHTGERPYSCHICHKGFTMRDKLKRHVRIHSGEKLFSCEYCGNNYSTSYGLTVHLKSHIVRNY